MSIKNCCCTAKDSGGFPYSIKTTWCCMMANASDQSILSTADRNTGPCVVSHASVFERHRLIVLGCGLYNSDSICTHSPQMKRNTSHKTSTPNARRHSNAFMTFSLGHSCSVVG